MTKPTPVKFCGSCGKKLERKRFSSGVLESLLHFNRRKFCNLICFGKTLEKERSEAIRPSGARAHARRKKPKGDCERCGRPMARDVHHKNEDFRDNRAENLERICRRCHNLNHSKRGVCSIPGCGRIHRRYGFCDMHAQRFKKHGDPLAYKIPPKKPCSVAGCDLLANSKLLCGRHYMQAKRSGTLPPPASRKEGQ